MLEEEVATECRYNQQVWTDNDGEYFGVETFEKNDQQLKDDESSGQVLKEFPEFWLQCKVTKADEHQRCIEKIVDDAQRSVYTWWNFYNACRYQVNDNDLREVYDQGEKRHTSFLKIDQQKCDREEEQNDTAYAKNGFPVLHRTVFKWVKVLQHI